jgi:hypothetical protein
VSIAASTAPVSLTFATTVIPAGWVYLAFAATGATNMQLYGLYPAQLPVPPTGITSLTTANATTLTTVNRYTASSTVAGGFPTTANTATGFAVAAVDPSTANQANFWYQAA